jgi:NAD-dependent deacetylase
MLFPEKSGHERRSGQGAGEESPPQTAPGYSHRSRDIGGVRSPYVPGSGRPLEAIPGRGTGHAGLVWEWYDWRRGVIASCAPHAGHYVLARWEELFAGLVLVTQNVDGLHGKAGSKSILELHGNIWQVRCTREGTVGENYEIPLRQVPPTCPNCGALLRPNVVWFGEALPRDVLEKATAASAQCDLMFVIGTSAFVQPAASLPFLAAERGAEIVEINPSPTPLTASADFSVQEK